MGNVKNFESRCEKLKWASFSEKKFKVRRSLGKLFPLNRGVWKSGEARRL